MRLASPPPGDAASPRESDDAASDGGGDDVPEYRGPADSDSEEAGPSGLAPASSDESEQEEPARWAGFPGAGWRNGADQWGRAGS